MQIGEAAAVVVERKQGTARQVEMQTVQGEQPSSSRLLMKGRCANSPARSGWRQTQMQSRRQIRKPRDSSILRSSSMVSQLPMKPRSGTLSLTLCR